MSPRSKLELAKCSALLSLCLFFFLALYSIHRSNPRMDKVIAGHRLELEKEMERFRFPDGESLDSLSLERGGRPMRILILAGWRSGSSFLGEMLSSVPGMFYHYEPLLDLGMVKIRDERQAQKAIGNIRRLFQCDYTGPNAKHYLDYSRNVTWGFEASKRVRDSCQSNPEYCFDPTFLSHFCRLYPFHLAKVVRLRLSFAERLLSDESLNLKIILLVRDPRGTIQSRQQALWCLRWADCTMPSHLCQDLLSDYISATRLALSYPERFRVIRYEELAVDPQRNAEDLLRFLGLQKHKNVEDFLWEHTKMDQGDAYSTYRDSRKRPFRWREEMGFEGVQEIQRKCSSAMRAWGYVMAPNATMLTRLDPITNYTLNTSKYIFVDP